MTPESQEHPILRIDHLAIESQDIPELSRILDHHSADGGNVAPTLAVRGVPSDAIELAIIVHDPDAPMPHGFTHWTLYGVPATDGEIDAASARTGLNSAGQPGWYGPQPPAGHGVHHYYFWVYALSRPVEGEPTGEEFLDDYVDAILEQARFVATYSS